MVGLIGSRYPVFQTVSLTPPQVLAPPTLGIPLLFLCAKLMINRRIQQFLPGVIHNVSQFTGWLHEKIAGIHITIILHHKILTAILSQGTDVYDSIHLLTENGVEVANGDFMCVFGVPLIIDLA